jgi:hypothetical protein
LPEPLGQATPEPTTENKTLSESTTVPTLDEAERGHILRALEATGWRINGPKGAAAQAPSLYVEIPHEKTRPHQAFGLPATIATIEFALGNQERGFEAGLPVSF